MTHISRRSALGGLSAAALAPPSLAAAPQAPGIVLNDASRLDATRVAPAAGAGPVQQGRHGAQETDDLEICRAARPAQPPGSTR